MPTPEQRTWCLKLFEAYQSTRYARDIVDAWNARQRRRKYPKRLAAATVRAWKHRGWLPIHAIREVPAIIQRARG